MGKPMSRQTGYELAGSLTMLVGMGASLYIYFTSQDFADSLNDQLLAQSKPYDRALEVMGGKANLMAELFKRWFFDLWQGTHLAYTVAAITVLVSFCLFVAAHYLDSDPE